MTIPNGASLVLFAQYKITLRGENELLCGSNLIVRRIIDIKETELGPDQNEPASSDIPTKTGQQYSLHVTTTKLNEKKNEIKTF